MRYLRWCHCCWSATAWQTCTPRLQRACMACGASLCSGIMTPAAAAARQHLQQQGSSRHSVNLPCSLISSSSDRRCCARQVPGWRGLQNAAASCCRVLYICTQHPAAASTAYTTPCEQTNRQTLNKQAVFRRCWLQVLLPYLKAKLDGLYARHSQWGVLGLALSRRRQQQPQQVGTQGTKIPHLRASQQGHVQQQGIHWLLTWLDAGS